MKCSWSNNKSAKLERYEHVHLADTYPLPTLVIRIVPKRRSEPTPHRFCPWASPRRKRSNFRMPTIRLWLNIIICLHYNCLLVHMDLRPVNHARALHVFPRNAIVPRSTYFWLLVMHTTTYLGSFYPISQTFNCWPITRSCK